MALQRYTVTDVTPFFTYHVNHFQNILSINFSATYAEVANKKGHSAHLPFWNKRDRMNTAKHCAEEIVKKEYIYA